MEKIDNIDDVLIRFNAFMIFEKGLSKNTVEGYDDDVAKLLRYAAATGKSVESVGLDDLHDFLAALHDVGISPRSQARIVSGIRAFFHYLKVEGYIDNNPARLLELPKIGRRLPDVLTTDEIDAIEAQCDTSTYDGCRNRAMIETAYSCGLRVNSFRSRFPTYTSKKNISSSREKGKSSVWCQSRQVPSMPSKPGWNAVAIKV